MGLRIQQKEFKNGLLLNNVYCKISHIAGNQTEVHATIFYYINQDARTDDKCHLEEKTFTFIHDNNENALNIFKQAYEYLKTNDIEFANAIDC